MPVNFRHNILVRMVQGFDLAAVCFTFLAALVLNYAAFEWRPSSEYIFMRIRVINVLFFGGYLAFCLIVFSICGFYQYRRPTLWERMGQALSATILLTGALWAVRAPLQFSFATTRFLLTFWLLTFCTLTLFHELGWRMLRFVRYHWGNRRNVIIIGEGLEATILARRLQEEPNLSYHILQIIDAKEVRGND